MHTNITTGSLALTAQRGRQSDRTAPLTNLVADPTTDWYVDRYNRADAVTVRAPLGAASARVFPGTRPSWADRPWSFYPLAKRTLDLVTALLGLLLLAPLLFAVALAVRLSGPGPILYRQPRVGRYGRRFTLYKFRTMIPERRAARSMIDFPDRRHCLKTAEDPRITAIGRFLRKTCLDELPQLLNVLRGEMSLVGPRPELPAMLAYYEPIHDRRHAVVPGLSGWWQVNGRCKRSERVDPRADLAQKLADDLYYIERQSFWLDLVILLRTVRVVLGRRGAF